MEFEISDTMITLKKMLKTIKIACNILDLMSAHAPISAPSKISVEIIGISAIFVLEHGSWAGYLMYKTFIFHFLVKLYNILLFISKVINTQIVFT